MRIIGPLLVGLIAAIGTCYTNQEHSSVIGFVAIASGTVGYVSGLKEEI